MSPFSPSARRPAAPARVPVRAGRYEHAPPSAPGAATPVDAQDAPHPEAKGTIFAMAMILLAAATLNGRQPSDMVRYAAIVVGIGLAGSVLVDLKRGIWNLPRADLLAVLAFYFLTLFEFLFPQPNFNTMTTMDNAKAGVLVVLVAFSGLLLGRHLLRPKEQPLRETLTREIPAGYMIGIFWFACGVGYLHMLLAVNFNVIEMVEWFMEPRFSQPWSRGKFGDWKALIFELGMFIQILPPLAGIMIARRKRYPLLHLVLMLVVLGVTLFSGFASGTRNVFASFLVTFMIGYIFGVSKERRKEVFLVLAGCGMLMIFATYFMLHFRTVGFRSYFVDKALPAQQQTEPQTLYVDYNLYSICRLVEVFPRRKAYLGMEIPYLALIRPIPRAMWKNKPEGMTVSIEDAMEMEGLTISASFAGEAYMSGGNIAVFVIALLFGTVTGWWGYLASPRNSELGILIYASGFFAAVISMRSLFTFTTALLPTIAAVAISAFTVRQIMARAQSWSAAQAAAQRRAPPARRPPPR